MIILGIAAVAILFWLGTRPEPSYSYYDNVSGIMLTTEKTGGLAEGIAVIGGELVKNFDDVLRANTNNIIAAYVNIMYPEVERLSVNKDKIGQSENTFTYELVANTGQRFYVEATDNKDRRVLFRLSDENNEILNYDSNAVRTVSRDISTLGKTYLPKTIKTNGITFTIKQNRDSSYEIDVNSCGDQEIKDKALAEAQVWVKSLGYDVNEIEFKMPTLCDGSMRGK